MRILLINKFHYLRGGAERAYFDTARILESQGHEVAFFSMQHPKNEPTEWDKYFVEQVEYEEGTQLSLWKKFRTAGKIIWNFKAQKKLERLIEDFKPDVAHLHNIYHQLSPSIIWTLKKHSVPMVMTLHDYKVVCPNYNLFAHGQIWEKSKPHAYWRCVMDRCVKDSFLKSLVCTLEAYLHRWLRSYSRVDIFIAPSRFLIEKFREFGFTQSIEYVLQPLMSESRVKSQELRGKQDQNYFLYFGRLSLEKGVSIAIEAMRDFKEQKTMSNEQKTKLLIVGEGAEKENLRKQVERLHLEDWVKFLGYKTGEELDSLIINAQAVIVPSLWYENMPYTILEALQMGVPVIASKLGGIPERIQDGANGYLFEAGNAEDMVQALLKFNASDARMLREAARVSVEDLKPERYYQNILTLYSRITLR